MKKITPLAGAWLAGASLLPITTSSAADLPIKAPPRAAWVDSWAGPYIGVYFGAGAGRATESSTGTTSNGFLLATNGVVVTNTNSLGTNSSNLAGDMTGSMVDLFAGYNWRFGNVVAGGQIEGTVFSDVTMKPIGTRTFNTVDTNLLTGVVTSTSSGTGTFQSDQQLRSRVGLIGRVGFLARPDVLLYGLGGLELGHFSFPDGADPFGGGNNNKWVAGYTIGAGGEVKLNDNWSLRTEYRYLNFGFDRSVASSSVSNQASGANAFVFRSSGASTQHTNADFHLARIGLVYQFGDARPLSAMAAMPPAPGTAWGDSWAGPYVGAYFGAGAGRARETLTRTQTESNIDNLGNVSSGTQSTAGTFAGDMTGSVVDLFAGYNWRSGNFVAGGQVEGTLFSDITTKMVGTETSRSVSTNNGVVTSTTSTTLLTDDQQQLRSNVGIIGRAGYLVTPNVLLYGLGGLALGHFTHPDSYPDAEDRVGGKNGKWVAGYTVGAGGELKLTDNWSLRGEYRYLHFGFNRNEPANRSEAFASVGASSTSTFSTADSRRINADFHVGKVGLVYRFGEAGPRSAMAAMPGPAWNDGWAGPYIGAYFGAGAGRATEGFTTTGSSFSSITTVGTTTFANANQSTANGAGDVTGSTVDLFAGYNWRTGSFVAGGQLEGTVFSDVTLKTIGGSTSTSVSATNGVVTSTTTGSSAGFSQIQQQLRSNVGAVGRAGFLVAPNVLLYGLGGLALGHFTYPDANFQRGAVNGKWVAGYTVGAGGEVKLTDNWSLRGEYRYLHFGFNRNERDEFSSTSQSPGSTSTSLSSDNTARRINADFHTGKVGLVYRFGEPGPRSAMAAMPPGMPRNDGWAGPYMGAYFAAGAGRASQSFASTSASTQQNFTNNVLTTNFFSTSTSSGNPVGDETGSMVDLFAGYNWRTGNLVVGGQIEGTLFSDVAFKANGIQTFNSSSSNNGVVTTTFATNDVQANEQLRSNVGVIGRAGYLVTPRVLVYGLGGLALGHFTFPDSSNIGGKNGKWVAGYTAGAGGEYKLTERWSLRGEYRYMHFDVNRTDATSSSSTQVSGTTTILRSSSDSTTRRTGADLHLAKIGAAYSFCYCD